MVTPPHVTYPEQSQTMIYALYDNCGTNPDYDTVEVYILPTPNIVVSADQQEGCEPHMVQFNEAGSNLVETYIWSFGDGGISTLRNPAHLYEDDGLYNVSLTVTSLEGCNIIYTYEDFIRVYSNPQADFIASPEVTSIIEPEISFSNYSSTHYMAHWTFGDGDSSNVIHPDHLYDNTGEYEVQLVAETENGCTDTIVGTVLVRDEFTFYAPTAFTPDNNGENDFFFVLGTGIDPNNFKLVVFDRWGENVFETDYYDPENPETYGWDGKIKGKHKASVGTYSWMAVYKDQMGKEHQYSGAVTVLR